jgi:hypothetical protein
VSGQGQAISQALASAQATAAQQVKHACFKVLHHVYAVFASQLTA